MELWGRERSLTKASVAYPPSFYMHPKDPPEHKEMIEALEEPLQSRRVKLQNHLGTLQGHRIYANRKVAEKIEIQTRHQAELYNADVRQDRRYLAEHDIFPGGDRDESRFSPDFEIPLTTLELQIAGDPFMPGAISRVEVLNGRKRKLEGAERQVLSDLMVLIKAHDPDLILCSHADAWIPLIVCRARRYSLEPTDHQPPGKSEMFVMPAWTH